MLLLPGYMTKQADGASGPLGTDFTWDPASTDAKITLSNGNLSALRSTTSSGNWCSTRASALLADYQYWELLIDALTNGNVMVGVGNVSAVTNSYFPSTANGWGHNPASSGRKWNNATPTAYGVSWAATQVIGLAYRKNNGGEIYVAKNNVWMASSDPATGTSPMFSGVGTSVYAMFAAFENPDQVTLRAKQSAFLYTPPSGYSGAP